MKKNGWVCLFLFIPYGFCSAQQDALLSQYMFNQLVFNPAHAGSDEKIVSSILYRNQWSNTNYSPKTLAFAIHSPFNQRRNGIGFQVENTSQSFFNYSTVMLSYAYRIIFAKGLLAMGISGGGSQMAVNFGRESVRDPDDATIQNLKSKVFYYPEIGTGLYYQREKWYVGLATQHLIPLKTKIDNYSFPARPLHFYLNAGYKFQLSTSVQYIISGLYKHAILFTPQIDITQHIIVNENFWGGISYRTTQAMALQAGIRFDRLIPQLRQEVKIGYAFDWYFNMSSPSHEIMLIINWEVHKSPAKIQQQKIQLSPFYL